ncbi:CYTH domain-containing protein [Microbacteriaceae bacterium 4G12]
MKQEIEIEFKNIVTKEEFERLCTVYSIKHFTTQVNHYFETPSFSLKEAGSALRIRFKNDTYTLTLKQPATTGLLETHQSLTKQEAEGMLEHGEIIDGAVKERLTALQIPTSELQYYGSLTTDRAEISYENGLLVFDHSFYFNEDDYELEYEVTDEITGQQSFHSLLKQHSILLRPTKNKVQRFFLAKQKKQH